MAFWLHRGGGQINPSPALIEVYVHRVSTREPHSPHLNSENTSHEAQRYQQRKGNNRQQKEMKTCTRGQFVVKNSLCCSHDASGVLNNKYKAMVFPLNLCYPRYSLPLFLPQSRGLPSRPYPGHEHHYVIAPDLKCLCVSVLFTHNVFTPCKRYPMQFQRDSVLGISNMQRIMVARVRNICSMRHRIHPERGADAALGGRLLGNLLRQSQRLTTFARMRRIHSFILYFYHLADAFIQTLLNTRNASYTWFASTYKIVIVREKENVILFILFLLRI